MWHQFPLTRWGILCNINLYVAEFKTEELLHATAYF